MAKTFHVFMLIIFILILYVLPPSSQSWTHEDECSSLFQFTNNISTNDSASDDPRAYPKLASWKINTTDCCLWDGVECTEKSSGHVIAVNLNSSFLYGPINSNSTLFNLIHLRTLNLADNDFRFSQIPSGIFRLLNLEYLNLSYSNLVGRVPEQVSHLNRLISLDLSGNRLKLQRHVVANSSSLRSLVMIDCALTGEFPSDVFHLPMLELLDVSSNNDLFGNLPEFHGNNIQLRHLILSETKFHGELPASIGKLVHLNQLDLSRCNFSGNLPASVSNLTQLTILKLDENRFSGRIPSLLGLSELTYLKLSSNEFDGSNLSDWIGKLPNLLYLNLGFNNLSCEIPPSIGNLTKLSQLNLADNSMVGKIPSSLTNLTHLTELDLGFNQFTGRLPSLENLSNLKLLYLSDNNFDRWKLPDWLGKLNQLTNLQLIDVNLYGEIPPSMFVNLTQIEELILATNQIEGSIPPFPSTMTKLRALALTENKLEGQIPSSLLKSTDLEVILLRDNNISGVVEVDSFLALKKLVILSLSGNRITLSVNNNNHSSSADVRLPQFEILELESCNLEVFPDFLRFQDRLLELNLDDNKIDGFIPEWMGDVSKETLRAISLSHTSLMGFEKNWPVIRWVGLRVLDVSHNMLHGSIPIPSPTIVNFLVSNNKRSGKIPPSVCDLPFLQLLDLSFNSISGSIPPCLEKLTHSLSVLNLRGNTLQGTIPNAFTNGSKLQMINLSENRLNGKLPRSLGNCVSLQILDLGNNRIDDVFPFWLGELSKLQILILKFNNFHGVLKVVSSKNNSMFSKLRIVDLSFNSFSGDLPHRYFEEWSAMKEIEPDVLYMQANIDIIEKKYFWLGNYTYSMNMTKKGVKTVYEKILNILIAVDLSSNKFSGKIPDSIKSLTSLQLLNLSNNEISGVIPSSLGNLIHLESLDISSNKLSGKIPQELVQLNFLALFNVSYNKLTGRIPQGRQFSTFQNISYMGNPALCGAPLSKNCRDPKVSKISFDGVVSSDFPSGVDWVVILTGVGSGLVIGLVFGNHLTTRCYKWFLKRFRHGKEKVRPRE